jgi:thiaminase
MQSEYVTYLAEKTLNLVNISCSKSVQTYVHFLSDVAESQPLLAIIAFASRTERWDWLGKRMKSCKGPGNAYNDWIRGWSGMRIFTHSALFMALVHQVD